MRRSLVTAALLCMTLCAWCVEVSYLRVENLEKPLGIDTDTPRFSWIILSDKKNVRQTAYQIIVIWWLTSSGSSTR